MKVSNEYHFSIILDTKCFFLYAAWNDLLLWFSEADRGSRWGLDVSDGAFHLDRGAFAGCSVVVLHYASQASSGLRPPGFKQANHQGPRRQTEERESQDERRDHGVSVGACVCVCPSMS